jgi:hypothetical protein
MIRSRLCFGLAALLSASILFVVPAAWSQDPGTDAAMQAAQQANMDAMQAAQQANQAAMQAAQQANQDAMQANQMAMQQSMAAANASPWCCGFPLTASPRFSVKAGSYKKPITVRLTDKAWGAVIYYTTDGWSPTAASLRYTGPITIDSTTILQAIAIAPNCFGSLIASAAYKFPGAPAIPTPVVLPALPESGGRYQVALNVAIPLVFTAPVSSQTAQVGDVVSLQLAEDLNVGNVVLAPKGTPAIGKVIQVDHPAKGGLPGEIAFQVDSLTLNGAAIPLHATRTLAGKTAVRKAIGLAIIPGVGMASLLVHGQNALIASGAVVMATLSAGTVLPAPVS